RLSIIADSLLTPLIVAFILLGGFNLVDTFAREAAEADIWRGLIFAGILFMASSLINIPFSVYRTFIIEERYGFNRTTVKTFILDLFKGWVLAGLIGGIVFAAIIWFFATAGSMAWLLCWGAVTAFQLFILFIAPVTIMPLFNKFTPLEDGELKLKIEEYARKQDFKIKGVFTMDASRRSTKSNAYFTGFGRFRRIVLFDTLIKRHTVDELLSILAHEVGHYKKRHIMKNVLVSVLSTGLMFFILALFINNRGLFDAFRMSHTSIYASLFFFAFLYGPVDMVVSIMGNLLSRRFEYEADAYSARTYGQPGSMIAGLKKLSADNLSNLTPHPLKVFFTYSHPPVLERIRVLDQLRGIAGGSKKELLTSD
ncbi:MAG TPA: M48 family peptidase, partial [Proteobacteria bacterium]|nr:M48 family peptidase [Pseudomonadota bacterium]